MLDRRWADPWEFRPAELEAADAKLERIYSAAGRPGNSASAPEAVVDALLADLDVPAALAVAEEAGGDAARLLLRTLSLD